MTYKIVIEIDRQRVTINGDIPLAIAEFQKMSDDSIYSWILGRLLDMIKEMKKIDSVLEEKI